jgi:hypothetical protein
MGIILDGLAKSNAKGIRKRLVRSNLRVTTYDS